MVVIEAHGDVLIEEVRKPSTVVGHLAGARHARDIRMGQRMRILEIEEAVAEHQFEVIRARRINTRGHIVVLVVDGIDDDATGRDVESLRVVSIAAEAIDVRPIVLTTELEVAINTLELRRELVFPASIRQIDRNSIALVDSRQVLRRVSDVRSLLQIRFGLDVHPAEPDVEACTFAHHWTQDQTTRHGEALRTRLIRAGGQSRIVGKDPVLPPEMVIGDRVHQPYTTAGLIDIPLGLFEVFLLRRPVSRRQSKGNGVVTSTKEVVLTEIVLDVDILERDLIISKRDVATEEPARPVIDLEADTHITDAGTTDHLAVLCLGSVVLRIGS